MRFYRALLRLYPASFRQEYGDELVALFARRVAGRGRLTTWLAAIGDAVPNALAVHADLLQQDLRYTIRALRRAPGFMLTAVLVVALGVGANTAAFSIADFVLLRPLPFPEPDRLVKIWERTPGYPRMEASAANYRDWKRLTTSFTGMGAFNSTARNLVSTGTPRRLTTVRVTFDLMPTLGVSALVGRTIAPSDSFGDPTVVLSYGLWQTQFGGGTEILGQRIRLDGVPHLVIGVMPETFNFPSREAEAWTPLVLEEPSFRERNDNWLQVVARLRPGVTFERAAADLGVAMTQLQRQFPQELKDTGINLINLREELSTSARTLLLALCGAALCILLLACANLANLLLVRAISREREIAVRSALGAGRERLVRQLTTESIVLAALGGAAGVLVAWLAIPMLSRLVPETLPIAAQPTLDLRVLGFAALVVGATGLAFGVVPAMRADGPKALAGLRDGARAGGGRRQRLRAALVTVEVAASVVLLISTGLLVRTLWRIQAVDPGFRTADVLTLRTALPWPKYAETMRRADFYARVLADVRALPGVTSAAYTSFVPMAMGGGIWPVGIRGVTQVRDGANTAGLRFVTPQFFSTLGIPLRRGRDVDEADDTTRTWVAVVSESFVKRFWPNEDPLGKQFEFGLHERTVVGVVGDIRVRGPERPSEPQVYLPYKQVSDGWLVFYTPKDLIIRSAMPPSSILPAVRRIVQAVDAEQPISNVKTMDEVVADQTAARAAQLRVLAILAVVAMLLAGVGIHGLLSFAVTSRSHEIGVRLALGARSNAILGMILREGLALALLGVVPGVLIAYAGGRAMESLLVGVKPGDGPTYLIAAVLCSVTAVVSCLPPALRASRVDPIAALRSE